MNEKPDWWPENPYPANVFPLTMEAYADLIDAETRTAVSGCLGRFFWDIASDHIFAAMQSSDERQNPNDVLLQAADIAERLPYLGAIGVADWLRKATRIFMDAESHSATSTDLDTAPAED